MRTLSKNTVISSGVQRSREIYLEIDLSIPLRSSRDDDALLLESVNGCLVEGMFNNHS